MTSTRDHFTDFDLDSQEFTENYEEVLGSLVSDCPVAHSNVAGGYYVVSRYDDVRACAQDWQTFSSEGGFEPGRGGEGGAKLYPVELDPPYQTRWRNALGPYFSPRAIRSREANIREQVTALIDGFVEKGEVEFVAEFAAHLPGRVFFGSFLGVPLSELPYARLAADRSLWPGAIEELVRYYASIVAPGRTATRDREVAGQEIKKGDFLMLSFAAAARDPKVFANPHEVDLDRKIAVNPAFSFGSHRCIGSHIARLEATIALEEILRRLPDLALAEGGEPVYSNSTITRNMDRLHVTFTPGKREGTAS